MARFVNVAIGQLGPISRSEARTQVMARLLALMREAAHMGCDLIVYPELALTTFFPRWYIEDAAELDAYYEREMPGAETQALLKKMDELKLAESSLKEQQEALRELDQSLKALEAELKKKEESLKALEFVVEPKLHIVHEHGEAPEVEVEEVAPDEGSRTNIIKMTRGKEASAVMLNMKLKGNSRESYEKAVAKLKQELPQGYKLEPKFIEESGMMIIKITGAKGTEEDWEKVRKLIKELKGELKE